MLRLSNVYKTVQKQPVINGITLDFLAGNIYHISTHSELSCDTLCSLLTGYSRPTIGNIQRIGSVCPIIDSELPQDTMLISYLEFILAFAQKKNPTLRPSSILLVLKLLELDTLKFKRIGTLSESQQTRVKIASGLLSDCDTLVFGAPILALPTNLKAHFFEFLHSYKKNKTIIIITRQASEDIDCDEFVQIHNGRVESREVKA